MKIKKAWLIKTDTVSTSRLKEVERQELNLENLYPILNCRTIEHVELKKGVSMWCDESGLLIDEPKINYVATQLYRNAYPNIPKDELFIFGDVVVTDNTKMGNYLN